MTGRLYRVRYVGTLAVEAPVERFRLSAPRPNPARGPVALELFLERETTVSLRVLDVQGREVWREPESRSLPGPHRIAWNGCIRSGDRAIAGVYFLVVHVGEHAVARRATLFH
jgi:hypothetical protein